MTYTLTKLGYLRYLRSVGKYGKYQIGSATLALAYPFFANAEIRQRARLPMMELADYSGRCVAIAVRRAAEHDLIEVATRARDPQFTSRSWHDISYRRLRNRASVSGGHFRTTENRHTQSDAREDARRVA